MEIAIINHVGRGELSLREALLLKIEYYAESEKLVCCTLRLVQPLLNDETIEVQASFVRESQQLPAHAMETSAHS